MPAPTLEAGRVVLRPFNHCDAPAVQRLAGDREIASTTLLIPHPYEDGLAESWIASHEAAFAAGTMITFAVTLRETGELLGAISLTVQRSDERAEMGYWIGKPFWGKGYGTEAATAVLRFAFEELSLNRVYAHHMTRNPSSGRIMQKLGMAQEGLLRQHQMKWDVLEDLAIYGILKSEWIKQTAR